MSIEFESFDLFRQVEIPEFTFFRGVRNPQQIDDRVVVEQVDQDRAPIQVAKQMLVVVMGLEFLD